MLVHFFCYRWWSNLFAMLSVLLSLVNAQIALKITTNATVKYEIHKEGVAAINGEPSPTMTMEFLRVFNWGSPETPVDATHKQALTIEQAFFGTELSVILPKKIIRDENCPVHKCPVCGGTTQVAREVIDADVKTHVVTPCPECRALGMITMDCNPFKEVPVEPVSIKFPPGTRPGHQITLPGLGNPCFREVDFAVGDLVLTVSTVGKDEGYDVTGDGVTLTVTMTPDEALDGFVYEKSYITDDEFIRIDRRGKVTIPGSTVHIKEMGFPIKNATATSTTSNTTSVSAAAGNETIPSPASMARDDLVIKFELEEESPEDKGEDTFPSTETVSPAGMLLLDSQEAIDAFITRSERKKKNRMGRDLLLLLRKHKEAVH